MACLLSTLPHPLFMAFTKVCPSCGSVEHCRQCICSNCEYVFRAPKVSKKCIVRANESEQECLHGSVLMQVSGLSQTDALFSPWVATLSHTQSSGHPPPLRLPRLKPKESRDPVMCCQYTDSHRGIYTFSAIASKWQLHWLETNFCAVSDSVMFA